MTLGGQLVPLPPTSTEDESTHPEKTSLPLDYPHVVLTALKGRPRLSRLLHGSQVDDLDVVDVAWIDDVWKTAQDWVWGRPFSAGLGGDPGQADIDHLKAEDEMDSQVDTGFATMQGSAFPLPGLPDRQPYRIPNTSLTILERIRNRDNLAVCEASDVAICLKETLKLDQGERLTVKRKRQIGDGVEEETMPDKKVKREMNGREIRQPAAVQDLTRGFSAQASDLEMGLPGYLAHLQAQVRDNQQLSTVTGVKIEDSPDIKVKIEPGEHIKISPRDYTRLGKNVSLHIDHPKQDRQVLAMSKEEQESQDVELVDGVRTLRPLPFDIELEEIPNLSIQRCSPLICVNDDIVSGL